MRNYPGFHMALSHHPRDGRTSVKTIGEGACNWLCRPHFTDGKERTGNHMQMCLPTACAMADGVGFVCAVCVLCGVVWCACVRACVYVCVFVSIKCAHGNLVLYLSLLF